jgi:hypothetical protein
MSDKFPSTSKIQVPLANEKVSTCDVKALISLLDYIQPEVAEISATAVLLLRLAQRALAEDHHLH